MEYRVIATLGPASAEPATWSELLAAGASGFRLNTSHLTLEALEIWLARLGDFFARRGEPVPVTLDLQGSKWRVGQFAPVHLHPGQTVELLLGPETDRPGALPVPHPDFFAASPLSGEMITLNDARIQLRRTAAGPDWLQAQVITGGELLPRKGITYQASDYRQEALNEKDWAVLRMARSLAYARFAISYVRDAAEMERYAGQAGAGVSLIAKLERQPAVQEARQIAAHAHELWLCRGDLGAELGWSDMAKAAALFGSLVGSLPRPTLLAGQVLEHMTLHPQPTRSEVSYLYESLLQGYQGIVLSDETAVGKHPVAACRMAALFNQPV
jgi:pyruvate kinase